MLVDDVSAGGRGDRADAARVVDGEQQQGVAVGIDPPGSTGTVMVPPRATSGVGHCWRHLSVPHHTGAALDSPGETVRVTVVGADVRPSAVVPSVTA